MMFPVSRLEAFIQLVGYKMISYPQWHNFLNYFWNERQVRHRPVVFKISASSDVFFKSGVTRADLKQDGKTADSNDKFTIRVMRGASRWRCFFKIGIGIGSDSQDLGGEALISSQISFSVAGVKSFKQEVTLAWLCLLSAVVEAIWLSVVEKESRSSRIFVIFEIKKLLNFSASSSLEWWDGSFAFPFWCKRLSTIYKRVLSGHYNLKFYLCNI